MTDSEGEVEGSPACSCCQSDEGEEKSVHCCVLCQQEFGKQDRESWLQGGRKTCVHVTLTDRSFPHLTLLAIHNLWTSIVYSTAYRTCISYQIPHSFRMSLGPPVWSQSQQLQNDNLLKESVSSDQLFFAFQPKSLKTFLTNSWWWQMTSNKWLMTLTETNIE